MAEPGFEPGQPAWHLYLLHCLWPTRKPFKMLSGSQEDTLSVLVSVTIWLVPFPQVYTYLLWIKKTTPPKSNMQFNFNISELKFILRDMLNMFSNLVNTPTDKLRKYGNSWQKSTTVNFSRSLLHLSSIEHSKVCKTVRFSFIIWLFTFFSEVYLWPVTQDGLFLPSIQFFLYWQHYTSFLNEC